MTSATPTWHSYDPGEPPNVAFQNDCSLLVLLATPAAREAEWAERTAVSLARDWARQGARIFLVDLAMSRPRLHSALGDANGEGISDVLLYGASLKRIARPVPDGFLYAPTGTPVLDGAQALESPRWSWLSDGFAQAGAQLVAFLPSDEPGNEAVLTHAGRVLVLAAASDAGALPSGLEAGRVSTVLSPPQAAALAASEVAPGGTPMLAGPLGTAPGSPPLPPLSAEAILPDPDEASESRVPLGRVALVGVLVVLLLLAVLAALGVIPIPGLRS
jgi:hypothetical protein